MLNIIAAVSDNGVIGNNGVIPWHLPEDLAHFRELTTGHTVIMGRKTWDSIGHALPNRTNIVITSQDKKFEGAQTAHSLDEAIEMADTDEVFIIGGGEIYKQAMDKADRLYITRVQALYKGDTFFPTISEDKWARREVTTAGFLGWYEVYERATARDRLIAAWRKYIKGRELMGRTGCGEVGVSGQATYSPYGDMCTRRVSLSIETFSDDQSREIADLFKDMCKSLYR